MFENKSLKDILEYLLLNEVENSNNFSYNELLYFIKTLRNNYKYINELNVKKNLEIKNLECIIAELDKKLIEKDKEMKNTELLYNNLIKNFSKKLTLKERILGKKNYE